MRLFRYVTFAVIAAFSSLAFVVLMKQKFFRDCFDDLSFGLL